MIMQNPGWAALHDAKPNLTHKDGTLWRSHYGCLALSMTSLFSKGAPRFFFVEVAKNQSRKWWTPWRKRFVETGRVYQGFDMDGFEKLEGLK